MYQHHNSYPPSSSSSAPPSGGGTFMAGTPHNNRMVGMITASSSSSAGDNHGNSSSSTKAPPSLNQQASQQLLPSSSQQHFLGGSSSSSTSSNNNAISTGNSVNGGGNFSVLLDHGGSQINGYNQQWLFQNSGAGAPLQSGGGIGPPLHPSGNSMNNNTSMHHSSSVINHHHPQQISNGSLVNTFDPNFHQGSANGHGGGSGLSPSSTKNRLGYGSSSATIGGGGGRNNNFSNINSGNAHQYRGGNHNPLFIPPQQLNQQLQTPPLMIPSFNPFYQTENNPYLFGNYAGGMFGMSYPMNSSTSTNSLTNQYASAPQTMMMPPLGAAAGAIMNTNGGFMMNSNGGCNFGDHEVGGAGSTATPPNCPTKGPGPPIITSGERIKGPRGCNLFVFHLPNEITNWDLYLLFRKFGTILSVHIMISKTTGLSRGFGFVSYASKDEAVAAIAGMDGFRVGNKRFKVQLKRSQIDLENNFPMDENIMVSDINLLPSNNGGEDECQNISSSATSAGVRDVLEQRPTTYRKRFENNNNKSDEWTRGQIIKQDDEEVGAEQSEQRQTNASGGNSLHSTSTSVESKSTSNSSPNDNCGDLKPNYDSRGVKLMDGRSRSFNSNKREGVRAESARSSIESINNDSCDSSMGMTFDGEDDNTEGNAIEEVLTPPSP